MSAALVALASALVVSQPLVLEPSWPASQQVLKVDRTGAIFGASYLGLSHLHHDVASPADFRAWLQGIGRATALYGSVLAGGTGAGLEAYALHRAKQPRQGFAAMAIGFAVQQLASAVTLRLMGWVQGRAGGWVAALFCQGAGLVVGAIPLAVVFMLSALAGPPPPVVAVPTLVAAGVLSSWVSVAAYGSAEGRGATAPVMALRF